MLVAGLACWLLVTSPFIVQLASGSAAEVHAIAHTQSRAQLAGICCAHRIAGSQVRPTFEQRQAGQPCPDHSVYWFTHLARCRVLLFGDLSST